MITLNNRCGTCFVLAFKTKYMNLVKTLEGGLKNPASLALLQEAIKLINSKPPKAEKKGKGHTEIIKKIQHISGKAMSVTLTPLSEHYMKRFVRIARIFPQNDG